MPYCESLSKVIKSDQTYVFNSGNHEAEMCYGGEADLHKHVNGCKKNPGHKGFIPLKDFNTNYLPSRFHDDDLMSETIKTLAALTVQVKTKFTSLERPEFYPGTQVPYPCCNDRGSHVMRLGTGRVMVCTSTPRVTELVVVPSVKSLPHPAKCGGRFMC
ncbi:uncharacterized protein LOC131935605 [Physella acuta]|uniref:uncharacterized protein LOC131935605 n=1 Tax=Physella acuta TaxID=109671 RepID=UPI0027DB2AAE|nr:uncharacterized protein LOC131935605 [Physella acuta]